MGLKEASCTHSFDLFFPESLSKGCSFFGGMSFHPFRKVTSNESNTSIFMAYQSQYGVGVHVGESLTFPTTEPLVSMLFHCGHFNHPSVKLNFQVTQGAFQGSSSVK